MTSETLQPYVVPREPGRNKAIALAVLVHAVLFAFLWVGINWVSQPPESLTVDTVTQEELDQVQPDPPQPVITPKVEDKTPVDNDAEIKIAQQKKKEAEDAKAAAEAAAQKKADEKKKADDAKLKAEQEAAEKKHDEDLKKEQAKKDAADQKKLAAMFQKFGSQDLKNGAPSNSAPAKAGGGNGDSIWIGKMRAKIKSLISFNPAGANPDATVEFDVTLLPDGSVGQSHMTKSSGIPAFDQAVARAIDAAAPYPSDKTGVVPKHFTSSHRLGDQ